MTSYQLASLDARLLYLALRYHLARPGSELDPETRQPATHGLTEVAQALEPQLGSAVATIELSAFQHRRLLDAISGTMNELKTYPLLDPLPGGGRHTALPEFDTVLRRLFPEVEQEPDEAPQLAAHLIALRRRLEAASPTTPPPAEAPSGRARWRFWRRS